VCRPLLRVYVFFEKVIGWKGRLLFVWSRTEGGARWDVAMELSGRFRVGKRHCSFGGTIFRVRKMARWCE
jgi:hypothetical protein